MSERIAEMLVVDDDPRNRKLLESYLTTAGYRVRSAPDGPAALSMAHEQIPDVILLDVMMSGMNGFEVCRELKAHPRTRMCQVVLVTALDGTSHRVEGLDGGADDYIAKPVRKEEFLAKVRSLLRARELMIELAEAREQLSARNEELLELQALKETLTQTMVHDLKNPLTAVIGNLQLLARKVAPDCQPLVDRCTLSAERMHRMILDLLDIARLEEGRLTPVHESVDALELLSRAIDDVQVAAANRDVDVVMEPAEATCVIEGDVSLLRRVVDNLLSNALEHSPGQTRITVRADARDEGIELSVSDEGPGIPEDQRDEIFEKFARLDAQTGTSSNRGLGLTFCRLAVEAHGGVIWVESAPGGGAVFRTLLPSTD